MQQQLLPGLLLSFDEVAIALGIEGRTLRRWRKEGGFPEPLEFKRQVRWRSDDILRWLIEEDIKKKFSLSGGHERTFDDQEQKEPSKPRKSG